MEVHSETAHVNVCQEASNKRVIHHLSLMEAWVT